MTQRQLACEAGLRPQLITDYLNADDRPSRRDLPAERIAAFEAICGNTLVTQWLAARGTLTTLEELQATRAAA
jgi:transcriptional regulator with XRE-family HTH domain